MRLPFQPRIWRRSIPHAWQQTEFRQPAKLASCVAISAINLLWHGHGVLRSSPVAARLVVVAVVCYLAMTIAEFLWFLYTGPRLTGFESPTAAKGRAQVDSTDLLIQELRELPPDDLRDETLRLAKEMKSFEAGSDREFVNTLVAARTLPAVNDAEHDEVLDKQSTELMEHNLRTWRIYREAFYRPARAFRDELRKRLGIRNVNSEPRIPALDKALLSGAKPIAQAADYLAALARRLK